MNFQSTLQRSPQKTAQVQAPGEVSKDYRLPFGKKYTGLSGDEVYQKDPKYFLWMYNIIRESRESYPKLLTDMEKTMENAGCERFGGRKGLNYCRACKSMHNIP